MDTDMEIRRDEYYRDHLGMCGTCYWKKKKYCDCESSQAYGDRVFDNDSCGEWMIMKGYHL